jgi:hypothetical protein
MIPVHLEMCECHVRCWLVAGVQLLCALIVVYSNTRDSTLPGIVGASVSYVVTDMWFGVETLAL